MLLNSKLTAPSTKQAPNSYDLITKTKNKALAKNVFV